MFDRVVVATDFSEGADQAFRAALQLAKPGGEVTLVHVLPSLASLTTIGLADVGPLVEAQALAEKDAKARLDDLAKSAGRPVATCIATGSVAGELQRVADDVGADLVTIGAKGHSRMERLLLGSTARATVRRVHRDVLVVRGPPPYRRLAVGTDLYAPSAVAAKRAKALAVATGASIELFHAADPALWGEAASLRQGGDRSWVEASLRKMLGEFNAANLGGQAKEILLSGRPVEAALRHLAEHPADLLVVGDHGPSRLERAMIGSVAEGMAERAPCSVLVVRSQGG